MAFRSTGNLRSLIGRLGGSAKYVTSTTPKARAHAPTTTAEYANYHEGKRVLKGDFVPVYVAIGMIGLSMSLGLYTVTQQLMHSPGVHVRKKWRETVPEVDCPEKVVEDAVKLVKKSVFRKVAHVQEFDKKVIPDTVRKDAYAYEPHVETLKSVVGVDPSNV